jgi:hypothetical protein
LILPFELDQIEDLQCAAASKDFQDNFDNMENQAESFALEVHENLALEVQAQQYEIENSAHIAEAELAMQAL